MDTATIDRTDVLTLLRHLSRDRAAGRTRLASLAVVQRSLEDAGFEASPAARQYEIGRLLTDLVESELARLRSGVDRPVPRGAATVTHAIREDFGSGHRELEAWSAVYHVYLRPDLNLGLREVEALLGDRHRRTIQRRLRQGIQAVTRRLFEIERETRSADRLARLAARLPGTPRAEPLGCEAAARDIARLLTAPDHPRIVALGGPGGIGKSALAHLLARTLVAREDFDDAAWISCHDPAPVPPEGKLLEMIARQLAPGGTPADARLMLARRRYLVVVDAIDEPATVAAVLSDLGEVPAPTVVLATGRIGWSAYADIHAVEVPLLAPEAAMALLRRELLARGLRSVAASPDDDLRVLVDATEGHPLAIRLASSQLRLAAVSQVARDFAHGRGVARSLFRDMWAGAWGRAAVSVRSVLRTAIRLRGEGRRADVAALVGGSDLPAEVGETAVRIAVDSGMLTTMSTASRRVLAPGLFLDRYLLSTEDLAADHANGEPGAVSAAAAATADGASSGRRRRRRAKYVTR